MQYRIISVSCIVTFILLIIIAFNLEYKADEKSTIVIQSLNTTVLVSDRIIVTDIMDGDTIRGDIYLGLDIVVKDQVIRCSDYDAWESHRYRRTVPITDAELRKGLLAQRALSTILSGHEVTIILDKKPRDVYGRVLGRLLADGEYVGPQMIAGGHIRIDE